MLTRVMDAVTSPTVITDFDEATRDSIAAALWQRSFDADLVPPEVAGILNGPKNTPQAHGTRMRRYLTYLLDHPLSHTPEMSTTYERLQRECDSLSPQQAYIWQTSLLGAPSTVGYDQVPAPADLQFPRDHLPKVRSQVGWHFFVGSCWDTDDASTA